MIFKVIKRMYENGKHYEPGDEISLDEKRANALRLFVEPVTKEMEAPPVDKQVRKRKK